MEIDDFITQMRNRLENNFTKKFGSIIPNENSYHINGHKIVAHILENKYKDDDKFKYEMVIDCFKKIKKTKGNIYDINNIKSIVYLIYNFLDIRKANRLTYKFTKTNMTYKYKILTEAKGYGSIVTDTEITFKAPKRSPKALNNLYDIDVDEILKVVNNIYYKQLVTDNKVVKYYENEIIDINGITDYSKWNVEQLEIVKKVKLIDSIDFDKVKYYAGSDITFDKDDESKAVACFVIFDNKDNVVAEIAVKCSTNIPYKASYLAFREAPILLKLLDVTKQQLPQFVPEYIIFDGNGIWHPRNCGIATHFSVLTDIPCFGVAKNVLFSDGVTRNGVYDLIKKNAPNADMFVDVVGKSGKTIGCAYNSNGTVQSSIFISAGNNISLDTCKKITRKVIKHRVIEPVRQADLLSRQLVREM